MNPKTTDNANDNNIDEAEYFDLLLEKYGETAQNKRQKGDFLKN